MTRADKILDRIGASNPEGINQYSQGGGAKRPEPEAYTTYAYSGPKANEMTSKAEAATRETKEMNPLGLTQHKYIKAHIDAGKAHLSAVESHYLAARDARIAGDKIANQLHTEKGMEHTKAVIEHMKKL